MTTWPGFGDGTFHDPDRYVREGLEKDDPKPTFGSFKLPDAAIYKYKKVKQAFENQGVSFPRLDIHFVPKDGPYACRACGKQYLFLHHAARCESQHEVKSRNMTQYAGAPVPDAPEVTEAMKIMYPEEK